GAVVGHPAHVVEELARRVRAKVRAGDVRSRQVGHEGQQVIDRLVNNAHGARGKRTVPTSFLLRGPLEHHHVRTPLPGRQGRAHGRVPGAHHHHIGLFGNPTHERIPPVQTTTATLPSIPSGRPLPGRRGQSGSNAGSCRWASRSSPRALVNCRPLPSNWSSTRTRLT